MIAVKTSSVQNTSNEGKSNAANLDVITHLNTTQQTTTRRPGRMTMEIIGGRMSPNEVRVVHGAPLTAEALAPNEEVIIIGCRLILALDTS